MTLTLNNLFTKELPADTDTNNVPRQVYQACFSYVSPKVPSNVSEIGVNSSSLIS